MAMFGLFKDTLLVDEDVAEWIFATFHWALKEFEADVFFEQTQLVLPNNAFFPGEVKSVEEMAGLVFSKVKEYAHVQHWPMQLVAPHEYQSVQLPALPYHGRGQNQIALAQPGDMVPISFNPGQINKPESLISSFAHAVGHYVGLSARESSPGGAQTWPQTAEMVAITMGFGVVMANSAYTFRTGCGSCYNPAANRLAALQENEAIFALAIFCRLKNISYKDVKPHLKAYLRPLFKRGLKQVDAMSAQFNALKSMQAAA